MEFIRYLHYTDTHDVEHTLELIAPGPAIKVESMPSPYTTPDLFRQIESQPDIQPEELAPREYAVQILGRHSIRSVKTYVHDEQSTTSEIP